jgi:hypothetical protein
MKRKLKVMYNVVVTLILIDISTFAQIAKNENIFQEYNFSLKYEGTISRVEKNEFSIVPNDMKTEGRSSVQVSVNESPSVFLPGTFGGRYYYNEYSTPAFASNKIISEKLIVNGLEFIKEYWVVYGGAGIWEMVINSYTKHFGHYYSISLQHNFISGTPGTMAENRLMTKDNYINEAIAKMINNEDQNIINYNMILSSFTFTDQTINIKGK